MIIAVAVAFLGPERIPEAARAMGRFVRRVRDAFAQVRDEVAADEKTAEAFVKMQETVQEIAQAVNVRHVVRELSEPLLSSHSVRDAGTLEDSENGQESRLSPAAPPTAANSAAAKNAGESTGSNGSFPPAGNGGGGLRPGEPAQLSSPPKLQKGFHPAADADHVPPETIK